MPKLFHSAHPVGEIKGLTTNTVPDGYLICNGNTIGDAVSGATSQGSFYWDLFNFLWTNYTVGPGNTLALFNSSGGAIGRGTTALADWQAHTRLSLPNLIGRTLIGSGTYTDQNTAISGLAGQLPVTQILGTSGGAKWHTLQTTEIPGHSHGITDPGHSHLPEPGAGTFICTGAATATIVLATSTTGDTFYGESSTHTGTTNITATDPSTGGDRAHDKMNPYHVTNWMIRY